MVQHEVYNVSQVAHKIAELTKTKVERNIWKEYCDQIKRNAKNVTYSDTIDYTDSDDNDVSVFIGYDGCMWLVGIEK